MSKRKNILVVDDNVINRKLLRAVFEAEGMTVYESEDGIEALAELERHAIDVVISDILMPRMDGYSLCFEVRKRENLKQVAFIIYTSTYTSPGDEQLALNMGADRYIRKPAPITVLLAAANEVYSCHTRFPVPEIQPTQELHLMKAYNHQLVEKLTERNLELTQLAEDLQLTHEKLRYLLANSPAVIYALNLEGSTVVPTMVSDNVENLLGISIADANRFDWWAGSLHPEDRERVLAITARELTRDGYSIEYRLRHRNGSYRWVEDNNRVVRDANGVAREAVGVWIDITGRKEAEQALRHTQNWAESVLASVSDSYILFDYDWRYLYINQAGAEAIRLILDRSDVPILQHTLWELFPDIVGTELAGRYRTAMEERLNGEFEFHYASNDTWWHHRFYPVPEGLAVFATDISVRKRAEEVQAQRMRLADLLAEVGLALTREGNLRDILQRCVTGMVTHLDAAFARIWTLNAEDNILELQVSAGMYTHIDGPHARVPVGHLKIGLIAAERKPHVTNDVIGDPRVPEQEWAMNNGLIAFAGYPLVCDGQLLGVMAMFSRHQLGDFVTRSLASIADSIALGIREKYDQERIERHVGQLTTLRKIDQAIISSLDLNFVLDQITAEAQVQLQADAVHVLLFDQKSKRLASAVGRGFRTNEYRRAQPRLDDSIAGEIVLEQRAATVSAESGGDTELRKMQWFQKESFSTYYGLPLISKGQVKGVLELFHRKPFPHSVEWIRFAEAIARLAAIGIDNAILFNETQRTTAELQLAYDTTLDGWSAALDLRDKETEGHTKRVTELSVELARKMGFSEEELVHLRRGALLHDIGKMGVPDHILLKPAPLTEEEWVIMKMHPVYAHSLLSPIRYLAQSLDIPYCHHEKWDGTGYPRGLKGEQIPLSARIFTVADIWDAIRSDRPYRAAWSKEKALEHIKSLSGTHLDAQVVKVFLEFQAQTRF